MNQRWREGRDSYRPAGETIRPSEYGVAQVVAFKSMEEAEKDTSVSAKALTGDGSRL